MIQVSRSTQNNLMLAALTIISMVSKLDPQNTSFAELLSVTSMANHFLSLEENITLLEESNGLNP